jgi:MFS family permease
VEQINAVEYDLTCSIWTEVLNTAHRFAGEIEAGYVWINEVSRHFLGSPFGGYKQSGLGREECLEELLTVTQEKHMIGMLCWLTCLIVTSALLPNYLADYLQLTLSQMGFVLSAIGFGASAGTLIMPAISDRIGRKPVMIISTVGAFVSLILLTRTGAELGTLFAFLFATHFFNFALITLTVGPLSAEAVPAKLMATASGAVICVGEIFGGGIAPVFAGYMTHHFGIQYILQLATVAIGFGIVVALCLKETAPS